MLNLSAVFKHVNAERAGWFGAGLSAAAVGVVGYQLVLGQLWGGPLPGPQPAVVPTVAPSATPTRTPRPTATAPPSPTPRPTSTPRPTPTPVAPDLLATVTLGDPDVVVGAVATFVARTRRALESLPTPSPPR
jgi:hypothetical protein